jgi:hypothetical protein
MLFVYPIVLIRSYVSSSDKLRYSNAIPSYFNEVICGLMLGDGNIRLNGREALLSVQQTHSELTNNLWRLCNEFNLVTTPVKILQRGTGKSVYYFQTLTIPYFTRIWTIWYSFVDSKTIKGLPNNIGELLTPLAIAHWIIGDGAFDGYGRGLGRVTLQTDNYTLQEVNILRELLQTKYGIVSGLKKSNNADPLRGYAIRISSQSLITLRSLCASHIYPSLMYKLGL